MKEQGKAWLVPPYDATDLRSNQPTRYCLDDNCLCPMPWYTHDQPLEIQNIESRNLPKTYVACSDFKDFHFMARRAKSLAWEYYSLKTGHDAMVTLPNELQRRFSANRMFIICLLGNSDGRLDLPRTKKSRT